MEPHHRLTDHGNAVWAVGFGPRGKYLASGSQNGQVILRDATTLELLAALRADIQRVRNFAFSSDGRYLAAACYLSPSVTWDLPALRDLLRTLDLDW